MRLTLLSRSCLVLILSTVVAADLQLGFYNSTCPQVESIVRGFVYGYLKDRPGEAASLIRPFFHDCFHTGCDASFLIQHTLDDHSVERQAAASKNIGGFSTIQAAKTAVEAQCPGIVSCADVLALFTRDAVTFASNNKIYYEVPTGRRDTMTATGEGVDADMPTPNMTIAATLKMFSDRNFTLDEMVTLLGVHSIGQAGCNSFRYRIFNYNGVNGTSDPHMDADLRSILADRCANIIAEEIIHDGNVTIVVDSEPTYDMDVATPCTLDNQYYHQLLAKKGILEIDQRLAFDKSTAALVNSYANNGALFYQKFGEAMAKLGRLGVLVGDEGEIRTRCAYFNNDKRQDLPEEI